MIDPTRKKLELTDVLSRLKHAEIGNDLYIGVEAWPRGAGSVKVPPECRTIFEAWLADFEATKGQRLRASVLATREKLELADRCERYARIIEGITVVADDYRPGDPERKEPRETLLEAAAALRASVPADAGSPIVCQQCGAVVRAVPSYFPGVPADAGMGERAPNALDTSLDELERVTALWREAGLALKKEEASHLETIDRRDEAEECVGDIYYKIIGRSPEWSNNFGYPQALEEIEDAVSALKLAARPLPPREAVREAAEAIVKVWQEAPYGVSFGAFMERALSKLADALAALPPAQETTAPNGWQHGDPETDRPRDPQLFDITAERAALEKIVSMAAKHRAVHTPPCNCTVCEMRNVAETALTRPERGLK
jgi:hypothetical protein